MLMSKNVNNDVSKDSSYSQPQPDSRVFAGSSLNKTHLYQLAIKLPLQFTQQQGVDSETHFDITLVSSERIFHKLFGCRRCGNTRHTSPVNEHCDNLVILSRCKQMKQIRGEH